MGPQRRDQACSAVRYRGASTVLQVTYLNHQPQTRRPYGVMAWPGFAAHAGPDGRD
jgi:hypothetical protein